MSGRVVHFEIPFDDRDRASEFYREAFGWAVMTIPEVGYTLVSSGPTTPETGPTEPGFINGGLLDRTAGAATSPVVVVEVTDIDEALAKIESLGGRTVVGRSPIGDMGFAAYFRDSEDNVIGLWQSADGGGQ
jgi:predicted enzyme related to lactoylglutathione lyase